MFVKALQADQIPLAAFCSTTSAKRLESCSGKSVAEA